MTGFMYDSEDPRPWMDPDFRSPMERIVSHYADKGATPTEANHDLGPMDTMSQRMAVMSGMRQDADSMSDSGYAMCGSTSLVAGAVYGGGEKGVTSMINATEAYEKLQRDRVNAQRKKDGQAPLPEEHFDVDKLNAKVKDGGTLSADEQRALGDSQMDGLKAKLAKGETMSSDDMKMMQANLYHTLNGFQDDGNGHGAGISTTAMVDFMKSSPEIADMFRNNHMHLENLPGHIALGIHDPFVSTKIPDMIFDPQARAHTDGDGKTVMDSQLVTNRAELYDYKDTIQGEIDGSGYHKPKYNQ